MSGPGSQAPALASCADCSGWEGTSEKSPLKDTRGRFRWSPTLGSASMGWGGGAGPALHSHPPPSFIPKETVGSLEEAGHSLG